MIWFRGRLVAETVKPVISPGRPLTTDVYLNLITPLVNVLGLCSKILVNVLSHCIELTGTGKILGVGLTVTITT